MLIKPGIGLILLFVEIVCYIVYRKLDKDKTARSVYLGLQRNGLEIASLKRS